MKVAKADATDTTEQRIRNAFITLTDTKGFDKMTVSDIAREAHINRGTFYMHYTDKFDLRQQLLDDLIDDVAQLLIRERDEMERVETADDLFGTDDILHALRYFKAHYAVFNAISRSNNDMGMYDRLKDVLQQMIVTQNSKAFGSTEFNERIPAEYAMEILVSGVASIIWLWIRHGCQESPETILDIIEINKSTAPINMLRPASGTAGMTTGMAADTATGEAATTGESTM
ncbi:TetR/AcrR family transcriptional regulator [Bifidobacterium sp. 64T4]|uniref:TetR/AcrR family transcriptional regulator n=1 Tax=Bifidobacterium pongonis TaxID=2834432 RepID=UPI001C599016|nr:TetR/AcrR family transcriptional regulator [Bifidobacterium pongonis]MBW3094114.1 TetR/AcrR family transcriptional regulator [Bifidobacterium pongonis]